ncbi:MAG: diphosphomevalonate decarboxylase, partial [Candidatus Heimdallarchaeota archaeon]
MKCTVKACSNLALIKYWGNVDPYWHIPTNDSISVSLSSLYSTTTLEFGSDYSDECYLNGNPITGEGYNRISFLLKHFRKFTDFHDPIFMQSKNNFPTSAGIASSASGFGALAHALYEASGIDYTEIDVSKLARLGSGSAARTIHPGYAHWIKGIDHNSSFAVKIKEPDNLRVIVSITEKSAKPVSSFEAMELSKDLSPFFAQKAEQSTSHVPAMKEALLNDDFSTIGDIAQREANNLHAVINTTGLGISYWNVGTLEIMKFVNILRKSGTEAYY